MNNSEDHSPLCITVATGNAHKLAELKASLAQEVHVSPSVRFAVSLESAQMLSEVEENGLTFLENANIKAQSTPPNPRSHWVLAEDTGLAVEALAGFEGLNPFPGVRSNRWLTPALRHALLGNQHTEPITQAHRNAAILKLMHSQENRRAAFVTALVLFHPATGHWIETEGRWDLTLVPSLSEAYGDGGFGYDPIACPIEAPLGNPAYPGLYQGLTVAQLPEGIKTRVSHRALAFNQALSKLYEYLQDPSNEI
jgi:XTP/dITP diphosphohydrolase